MTLTDLQPGQQARVLTIQGDPAVVQRLAELGVFEGEQFEFLGTAPMGDPLEILVGNTRLSLRQSEAAGLTIELITS
jgi:Fe2+ transport system protein FeoA